MTTNEVNESDEFDPKLCAICQDKYYKYTCPLCELKTCSLTCCKLHKSRYDCSGVNDRVTFCFKNDYDTFSFQRDYRLLEDVDRRNAVREKKLLTLAQKNASLSRNRKRLLKEASDFGIVLRLAPNPVFTRAKFNLSRILLQPPNPKTILWSVEFVLIDPNLKHKFDIQTKSLFNSSIRFVVHNWEHNTRLSLIWKERVLDQDPDSQDLLISYSPPNAPPFAKLSSWLCHTNDANLSFEKDYYFYVQTYSIDVPKLHETAKSRLVRRLAYDEIFQINRLIDLLTRPGFVVHEMPVIFVSRFNLQNA